MGNGNRTCSLLPITIWKTLLTAVGFTLLSTPEISGNI